MDDLKGVLPKTDGPGAGYHDVVWTPDHVARFWGYFSKNPSLQGQYFSQLVGQRLIRFVSGKLALEGDILDLGCGPGFLMGFLIHDKKNVFGVDASAEAIRTCQEKFQGQSLFGGAFLAPSHELPFPDARFSGVFMLETLEHLQPSYADAVLKEIYRVLVPGGWLTVTVPNNEVLDANKVACPECGCAFHKVQHIQQFDPARLAGILYDAGFDVILSREMDLASPAWPVTGLLVAVRNAARRSLGKACIDPPNLVVLAKKRRRGREQGKQESSS